MDISKKIEHLKREHDQVGNEPAFNELDQKYWFLNDRILDILLELDKEAELTQRDCLRHFNKVDKRLGDLEHSPDKRPEAEPDLKPCHICHCSSISHDKHAHYSTYRCGCCGATGRSRKTEPQARYEWNRHDPS